ncbi:MAG: NUDIX hydrolase [Acidimicrobiales bacterium]
MESPPVIRAAGGIVVRAGHRGGWEVALVHRPTQDDWTLPKGKLDPGETIEECAIREVLEETGWRCELGRYAGQIEYQDARRRSKVAEYWMMQPVDGEFTPCSEVDELDWLGLDEAVERLSYERDRDLLASVATALRSATGH